ncbi:MAG: sodium:solute symporter family protein [Eubacteriales bacterium]
MQLNANIFMITALAFFCAVAFTTYLGHKKTHSLKDFTVGGRNMSGLLIALSYGASLVSTSAIVGFGGVAGVYGYSVYWGVFGNMLIGTFVAFYIYGKRVRVIGERLNAESFPDLLGKRFNSKFLQVLIASIIYVFIPAYTSIILIGGANFMASALGLNFNIALIILAVIVFIYVIFGGMIGVIYTDALLASIMFLSSLLLLGKMFIALGGINAAHTTLQSISNLVPENLVELGHTGWSSMPTAGSPIWWTVISTLILGITIGTLAQPQLAVKLMSVKNTSHLYIGIAAAAIFIWILTGGAEIVGILSNVYFFNTTGDIAIVAAQGNVDMIIPSIITAIMPEWFVYLFMFGLLSAAMSSSAALLHLQGVSFAKDIIGVLRRKDNTKGLLNFGTFIGLILAIILAFILPSGIIARATVFWFGLCAICWLPTYTGCLFWKGTTRTGAIASVFTGFVFTIFWYTFVKSSEAVPLGICKLLTGKDVLFSPPWTNIDPLLIGLPLSGVILIVISLITQKPSDKNIEKLFHNLSNK